MPHIMDPASSKNNSRGMEASNVDAPPVAVDAPPVAGAAPPAAIDAPSAAIDDDGETWSASSISLAILTFLAICYTLYFARAILLPIVTAVVLALPLRPLVRYLAKFRLPAWAASSLLIGGVVLFVGLGVTALQEPATRWQADAPEKFAQAERKLRSIKKPIEDLSQASEKVEEMADGDDGVMGPLEVEVKQRSLVTTLAGQTANVLLQILLMVLVLFFLLSQGDGLLTNIVRLMPTRREKREIRQLVNELEKTITGYMFKVTLINICLGTIMGTIFWLLGLPNPMLWGVMVALFNYVPIFGFVVGTAIIALVSIITFDSLLQAALAPTLYMIINGLEGNVITPLILGKTMRLNAVLVLLFLVIWGWMWGVAGAILAVPLLAAIKIICDRFERTQPLGALMG